jgi:2-amino-4-hydroxy-6-hydroxymethyldihydropteridine diphosphokinase
MHNCFLLLGSNQGKRLEILNRAVDLVSNRIGKVVIASSVYETEAWGFKAGQAFLNMVVQVDTSLSPASVLEKIMVIEMELGRVRNSKAYASRLIDIDILFYDDEIVDGQNLQIPHPRLHQRMFTLMPLMEICPQKIHPIMQKTIVKLTEECDDELMVKKIEPTIKQSIR